MSHGILERIRNPQPRVRSREMRFVFSLAGLWTLIVIAFWCAVMWLVVVIAIDVGERGLKDVVTEIWEGPADS